MQTNLRLTRSYQGPLSIWKMPDPRRAYSIGVDTAGGKTKDDWSVATICDVMTREDVAQWRGHLEPKEYSEELMKLAEFYGGAWGQALLVIETNNHGLAVLEGVKQQGARNLYTRHEWDKIKQQEIAILGWNTSVKTKPMLAQRGRTALGDPRVTVNSEATLLECMTFVRDENERMAAEEGCHDDAVMSWLLALEGCFYAQPAVANFVPKEEVAPGAIPPQTPREALISQQSWIWDRTRERMDEIEEESREVLYYD